ncbi:MAG: hypothetical protein GEV28_00255 [Actinophytocola sp.]|uniref:TrkA C-terminal domain-containing protein n=1 Tax=Actinophytocola sp. TaxID=1872138 RepID=UPI001321BB3C|nr:hypothetical protein [Actinophytocola sp.]
MFDTRWGVDVALPAESALAALIGEAACAADTIGLVRHSAAGVTLVETHIDENSAAAGRTVGEFTLPSGTVVAAVVHDAQPVVPGGDYSFQPGDTALVVTDTATDADIYNISSKKYPRLNLRRRRHFRKAPNSLYEYHCK